MGYAEESLVKDERIVFQARLYPLHWQTLVVGAIFAGIGFAVGWPGFGALILLGAMGAAAKAWLLRKTSEFVITNRRVLVKVGLANIQTHEWMLNKVEGASVAHSFGNKSMGKVTIVGTGGSKQTFDNIERPHEFRKALQEQIEAFGKSPAA